MKKIAFAIAALTAIAVAAPSIANAETVIVKHGHHMHRDWHPFHHHHDKVVIMKHRHD